MKHALISGGLTCSQVHAATSRWSEEEVSYVVDHGKIDLLHPLVRESTQQRFDSPFEEHLVGIEKGIPQGDVPFGDRPQSSV